MLSQIALPVALAVALMLVVLLGAWRSRSAGRLATVWHIIARRPRATAMLGVVVLFLVAALFMAVTQERARALALRANQDVNGAHNLIAQPHVQSGDGSEAVIPGWESEGVLPDGLLKSGGVLTSSLVPVREVQTYRYSLNAYPGPRDAPDSVVQLQFIWYDRALNTLSWYDTPRWRVSVRNSDPMFYTGQLSSPQGAAFARLIIRSVGLIAARIENPKFSPTGVHIELHPNAARASVAFSFDWETAMGGAIHSKGMTTHDPAAAAQHGAQMRTGADWLNELFSRHEIEGTFYGTGYNLIDGNTERRTFAGDPTYDWAHPKNGWDTEHWLTNRWYSDDPFGDYRTHPEWYFADQTRRLRDGGHEIASHTFGHLYVRGSIPAELGTDTDEWLNVAREQGIPPPQTFAFPWRSSNSLTADFYEVLYERGIRAVTRVYERDMRDLYVLAAPPPYPRMALMPDFLLGAPEDTTIEEADGGQAISKAQGLQVLEEVIARRGTTSFWNHPEYLAPGPALAGIRDAWSDVVAEAARQRKQGKLWVATVADIAAYQAGIAQVSARLDRAFLGWGGWTLVLQNDSGRELEGVTLTLPGDVIHASSPQTEVRFVYTSGTGDGATAESIVVIGAQQTLTRQLVLTNLMPGRTSIELEWSHGQEPLE